MNAPAKRHLQRLERILRTLDEREARMQQMQGDRIAGSIRSTEWRDAEALRAVLAYFDVAATTRGVMGAPAPERCPRGEVSKPEPPEALQPTNKWPFPAGVAIPSEGQK